MKMDETRAREILSEYVQADNTLKGGICFVSWPRHGNAETVGLDGDFSAEDLEAIAWWMRNAVNRGASHE